jgi:integrase
LPLAGVANVPVERARYRSTVDAAALLVAARNELAQDHPESFKAFLLALCAGLRRREIDTLRWEHLDIQRNTVRVETTVDAATKSAGSEGEVDVDPALLTLLRASMGPGCGSYVIQSSATARPQRGATYAYRCDRVFTHLIGWLRGKGLTGSPLHTLRKEFGSAIAASGGIFAASAALRHSDIGLTRDYYVDKKRATVFPVGDVLEVTGERKASA